MEVQTMYIEPQDPSLPPVPEITRWYPGYSTEWYAGYYCDCLRPIPEERADRHGAARTYCARCDRELPLRMRST
jgi:hypothetical protein